jgi:hypothetical protein
MIKTIQNPSAFPAPNSVSPNGDIQFGEYGMTLRDYFAGQAIVGMLGNITCAKERLEMKGNAEGISSQAYEIADAMLFQRITIDQD